MTTPISSIITSAYRESNLIPISTAPTADQITEAFTLLVTIVEGAMGDEVGENLLPMPLGQNGIKSPTGYPWWSNELPGNIFVPTNSRIMCNLTGNGFINLHPRPHDGARMGVVDVSNNFAEFSLTIYGNGRSIEGDEEMTYTTSGMTREWLYREDLGNWVVVTPLDITSNMPFPPKYDDFWIIMLAMRLGSRYGQALDQSSLDALKRARSQLAGRYKQSDTQQPSEDALLYLTNYYRFYGRFANRQYGDPADYFNSGFPY